MTRTAKIVTVAVNAAPSGVPTYAQGMADFQVRSLTGTYGPASGIETFVQAMPAEWRPFDAPASPSGVFNAWSGGKEQRSTGRLYLTGGGHSNGANNGLHFYDFSGVSRPAGWGIAGGAFGTPGCTLSAMASVPTASAAYDYYNDGKPGAVHSYDQTWIDPSTNSFYRFGGARYLSGNPGGIVFKYALPNGGWTAFLNGAFNLGNAATVIGDATTGKMLFIHATAAPTFVRPNGTFVQVGSRIYASEEVDPVSCLDTTRNRWLSIGYDVSAGTNHRNLITVNWSAETFSVSTFTPTGTDAAEMSGSALYGASVVYDAQRDSFWIFGGRKNANTEGTIGYILEMNAGTFAVKKWALSGNIPTFEDAGNARGSHNKHILLDWSPTYRAIGSVQSSVSPPFIIKLPNAVAGPSYSTSFSATENPLSEGGAWVQLATAWQDVRTLNGYAAGATYTEVFDDNYARLTTSAFSAPGDNYEVVATVYKGSDGISASEIEILLRVVDTATTVNAYEVLVNTGGGVELVRWNGAMGNYSEIGVTNVGIPGWTGNGDKIKARVTGTNPVVVTVWHAPASNPTNFTQLFQYSDTDATRKQSGQPGIAFYQHAASNNLLNSGWSDFTVTAV